MAVRKGKNLLFSAVRQNFRTQDRTFRLGRGSVWGRHEQRGPHDASYYDWPGWRGIEQALMQAKHIVTGPLGRKIVDRAPSLP
jgi:hypothetical protein